MFETNIIATTIQTFLQHSMYLPKKICTCIHICVRDFENSILSKENTNRNVLVWLLLHFSFP